MLEKGHGKYPKAGFCELKTDLSAMEIIHYELNISNLCFVWIALINLKEIHNLWSTIDVYGLLS